MRLSQLDLIRYGMFTDTTIRFPKSEHDFHVIVGPNEAGKSTVRTAVTELLFGIPRSSPLAFIHPQTELRVGASIENNSDQLEFHRTKATKGPLRTPADAVLPDDVLAPFLGTADRAFFEQMFGLDHAQLIKGGQTILDASKDVGQVLFQSAAGIASLGRIKEELVEEAGKLWGPRKSNDRAYYAGAAQLEEATRELKEATVRTRSWADAQAAVADADAKHAEARSIRSKLEGRRATLERIRRVAPFVRTLFTKDKELTEMGVVLDLPLGASASLNEGEALLAAASEVLRLREADVGRLRTDRDAISYDEGLLALKEDIEALESFRHRVRDHAADLALRGREVEQLLERMRAACGELGWPTAEDEVRAALPSTIALSAITRLVRERGALHQASTNGAAAVEKKKRDLDVLRNELAAIADSEVPATLRVALSEALALQNSVVTQRNISALVEAADRDLAGAINALGRWKRTVEQLGDMNLPSVERITTLRSERQRLATAVHAAQERIDDAMRKVNESRIAVEHYAASRHVVTTDEVRGARSRRDETWDSLKSGATPIHVGAPALDAAISLADELVDAQLSSATDAAELQSLRQRHERELAEHDVLKQTLESRLGELVEFDTAWAAQTAAIDLPDITLEDIPSWISNRGLVITAAATLEARRKDLEREISASEKVRQTLLHQLRAAGGNADDQESLAVLCVSADAYTKKVDAARERHKTLNQQLVQGERAIQDLEEEARAAKQAYERWGQEWLTALQAAKLSASSKTVAEAEAAIEQVAKVADSLEKVETIRRDRIEPMRRDLEQFEKQGRTLAGQIDSKLAAQGEIAMVSKTLGERLQLAISARQTWVSTDQAVKTATQQHDDAKVEYRSAHARVQPLLDAALVQTIAEARPLVERSDKKRQLTVDIESAKDMLTKGGDGLTLDAIVAEVEACNLATLASELDEVGRALSESTEDLTMLAEERLRAQQSFAVIAGQANAAIAEAKRQEALAAMADASERYLKVATASKLLRWAIDRYRDRKQGPMLLRASAIFSDLTLGRFKKLIVDYDREPLTLAAQRQNGAVVEVSGMSEGTRDQLYLALRLAALELHLEQAKPLPFIADDLLINFDDARAKAGLTALRTLSKQTQVIFLSHHDHLVPLIKEILGLQVNVVQLPF